MTHTTRVELHPPKIDGHTVSFLWEVSPPTDLYRSNSFTLTFPDHVDPARVPERLWWTIFLLCIHSHWPLLRPCVVRLPIKLAQGEAEGWSRLLDSYVATLEAMRGSHDFERSIELLDHGSAPEPPHRPVERGISACAYSGGKDSLVHAGLLCELTERPILVTTTSPMPPLLDHVAPQRRQLFDELTARRDVTFVEVRSDLRASWDNSAAWRRGYRISVNGMSDTFLYTAALVAVGHAMGATHLFLASENEVSENGLVAGHYVQHKHFMYSALTQAGIRAMLARAGLYYGSLTSALNSEQVQELLTTRYRDLRDLQFTCWQVSQGQRACSQCSECKRLAWVILSLGGRPSDMGIDLVHLLNHHGAWEAPSRDKRPHPPNHQVTERQYDQWLRAILATPLQRALRQIVAHQPTALLRSDGWEALRTFRAIRASAAEQVPTTPPPRGYRAGFLETVDPSLRAAVTSVFDEHFEREDEARYAGQLQRLRGAIEWVTEPFSLREGESEPTPSRG